MSIFNDTMQELMLTVATPENFLDFLKGAISLAPKYNPQISGRRILFNLDDYPADTDANSSKWDRAVEDLILARRWADEDTLSLGATSGTLSDPDSPPVPAHTANDASPTRGRKRAATPHATTTNTAFEEARAAWKAAVLDRQKNMTAWNEYVAALKKRMQELK